MCDDGLAPSVALVHGLIDAQIASGVPAERVLVGGFSQGSTVHTYPLALRGLSACWASPPQGAVARARLPALGGSITASYCLTHLTASGAARGRQPLRRPPKPPAPIPPAPPCRQGAALAAWAAAECTHKLGGVVLWSGYAALNPKPDPDPDPDPDPNPNPNPNQIGGIFEQYLGDKDELAILTAAVVPPVRSTAYP